MPDKYIPPLTVPIVAQTGFDILNGTKFVDTFYYNYTNNNNPKDDTLNTGDIISSYEYGEDIKIDGILLDSSSVDASIDVKKKELTLQIDTDGDGKADVDLVLENITRADVSVSSNKKDGSTTVTVYDDPIELGDGEEILLSNDKAEGAFFAENEDSFIFNEIPETDMAESSAFWIKSDQSKESYHAQDTGPEADKSDVFDFVSGTDDLTVFSEFLDIA